MILAEPAYNWSMNREDIKWWFLEFMPNAGLPLLAVIVAAAIIFTHR